MFSSCSVKCSVKMTFWYFITCYKYSIRNFQKIFYQTVILNTQKLYFCLLRSFILKYITILLFYVGVAQVESDPNQHIVNLFTVTCHGNLCLPSVSHANNSHVLAGKNPCNNQAIHVLFSDARLLYFAFTHSRPSQKLTSSSVTCIDINVI